MKSGIEVGQVLTLKIRFNNSGNITKILHLFLAVSTKLKNFYFLLLCFGEFCVI